MIEYTGMLALLTIDSKANGFDTLNTKPGEKIEKLLTTVLSDKAETLPAGI
jgi:hypothetical protein